MPRPLRTICERPNVIAEIDELKRRHPRFDDWWEIGWKWRLSHDPFTDAIAIDGTNPSVFLLKTSPNHRAYGFPFALTLMFTVTDNEVDLIEVRVIQLVSNKS